MNLDEHLGHRVTLTIRSLAAEGAYLADPADHDADADEVLLPAHEVPAGARVGDEVSVFAHLDSADALTATTRPARLEVGQVTFLDVTAVTDIGAFVDIGLGKELLVPFAQQSRPLFVGEREPIGMYLDKSRRLAGTMFVGPLLADPRGEFALDEWVVGEAWRNEPETGLFVILERTFVGLVPADEPHALKRGDNARFRVAHVLPDGKVVLSLRDHAHKELEADAARILARLQLVNPPKLGDRSDPDELRAVFGLSKKAFKRAVGRLLKDRAVTIDADGHVVAVPR